MMMIVLIQIFSLDVKALEVESKSIQVSTLKVENIESIQKESKTDTIQIQTSAVCKMCKERLEHDMAFEKGVKSVELDMETKELIIVYRKDKTTEENLKIAITEIGYDADEMIAVQKAHDRLPACCQKDNEPH